MEHDLLGHLTTEHYANFAYMLGELYARTLWIQSFEQNKPELRDVSRQEQSRQSRVYEMPETELADYAKELARWYDAFPAFRGDTN